MKSNEIKVSQGVGMLRGFVYLAFTQVSTIFGRELGERSY